ncbi:MAG TPA: hypothetical protein VH333_17740 [Pseudonocardiaceae bacterium]|nr:hypothetical protein [Pseudonocardiaceae bacterium]
MGLVVVCTVVGAVVDGRPVDWVGGVVVVPPESVVDVTVTVLLDVVVPVPVPVPVDDSTTVVDETCGAATSGPVVSWPSFTASGNGFSVLPTEPSRPVESPTSNRAVIAAPRIAPTANRPRPPTCVSTLCIYRFRKLQSSVSLGKEDVDHISTSACSARTFCHVSSSAGV